MFPYFPQPELHVGPWTIYAFGILEWVAAGVCWGLLVRRARRDGFDGRTASFLCLWAILPGLAFAHAAKIITDDPRAFLAHPLVLVEDWSGLASFGGLLGGLCGAVAWSRLKGDSWRETFAWLDRLAYVFPFAWIFARLGCTLAHDHRGVFTTSWLAFRYPEGPRYNLGLIELLFTLLLAAWFYALDRRRPARGTWFGLLGVSYGFFRLWLDTLHAHPPRYFGWTEDQMGAVPAILIGAAGLALAWFRRAGNVPSAPGLTAAAR